MGGVVGEKAPDHAEHLVEKGEVVLEEVDIDRSTATRQPAAMRVLELVELELRQPGELHVENGESRGHQTENGFPPPHLRGFAHPQDSGIMGVSGWSVAWLRVGSSEAAIPPQDIE